MKLDGVNVKSVTIPAMKMHSRSATMGAASLSTAGDVQLPLEEVGTVHHSADRKMDHAQASGSILWGHGEQVIS